MGVKWGDGSKVSWWELPEMVGEWKLDIESTKKMKKVKNSSKNI